MKKIIFSTVFLLGIYASAQVERLSGAMNISTGVYLKDMDNILPKFVGEWTAEYKDNQVILNIEKVEKHPSKEENVSYYRDVLFMRYTILNPDGKE
ncbi:hypothetical protein HZP17_12445, partial [Elizabethkingia anophelis]|nr:hypothetical protein [Elizabethkingia anophelis]